MKMFGRYDGGIGNRINNILNLLACYRSREKEVDECVIEWICNATWSSKYEDLFEPILGVKIINVGKACETIEELRKHFLDVEINENRKCTDETKIEDLLEGKCNIIHNAEWKGTFTGDLSPISTMEIEGTGCIHIDFGGGTVNKENIWHFLPRPNKDIIDETKQTISDLNLDKSFAGMHIRDTDHPRRFKNIKTWELTIEKETAKGNKVFIVSDSNEIKEHLLNKYPDKVITQLQKDTLFKLNPDKKWDERPYEGYEGGSSEYNVASPKLSCRQSLIDMLLLSYVYPDYGVQESTFTENAYRYWYGEWWND